MQPIPVILHPTDFSESSMAAFEMACSLARSHGSRVVVVHVVPPPPMPPHAPVLTTPPSSEYREHLYKELVKIQPKKGGVAIDYQLLDGDPAERILEMARSLPADLIVMGTHGRTGLERLVVGSVAEHVLRHASCPVLTVKTPQSTGSDSSESKP